MKKKKDFNLTRLMTRARNAQRIRIIIKFGQLNRKRLGGLSTILNK